MAFWGTDLTGLQKDPKRKFRFQVIFNGLDVNGDGIIWYAKTVSKPNVTVGETEHKFLGHTYYFPGVVEWSKVTFTLVDPVNPGTAAQMNALLRAAGYQVPGRALDLETMSKAKAKASLGAIRIIQMDAEGNPLETWELINPFITSLKFGELDYSDDALTELEMEVRYDRATCTIGAEAQGANLERIQGGTTPLSDREFFNNNESDA